MLDIYQASVTMHHFSIPEIRAQSVEGLCYKLDDQAIVAQTSEVLRTFFLLQSTQTKSGAHPSSYNSTPPHAYMACKSTTSNAFKLVICFKG
jgi:hypothetical protein